jgi:hypothetical protein
MKIVLSFLKCILLLKFIIIIMKQNSIRLPKIDKKVTEFVGKAKKGTRSMQDPSLGGSFKMEVMACYTHKKSSTNQSNAGKKVI